MAIEFENKSPNWEAEGTEPSASLKSGGFQAGYKPPAAYFNWFWKLVSKCITELQEKIKYLDEHGYEHPTTAGNKHIPKGGAQGQFLGWASDGTAKWSVPQSMVVEAISEDGVIYTATVDGITELSMGLELVIVPNKLSTNVSTKLNVNGLGDVLIRFMTGYNSAATVPPVFEGWMSAGKPISLRYNGQYWIVTDMLRLSNHMIYGTVELEHGGTGASDAAGARENLQAEQARTKVTGNGAIVVSVDDYKEYVYTAVTSLAMTGAAVNCHGFVTFGSSAPTITVSGFTASAGDDIAMAAQNEVWEFSVFPHNGGSYIIWKNWSA